LDASLGAFNHSLALDELKHFEEMLENAIGSGVD